MQRITYIMLGICLGYIIGFKLNDKPHSRFVKTEYYLEVVNDSTGILETTEGRTYRTPLKQIDAVITKDNL